MLKRFLMCVTTLAVLVSPIPLHQTTAASNNDVVINEVAWMGTTNDYNDEWIQLYNNTSFSIDLTNWILASTDGTPSITLSGTISANGYYLLERTDDNSVTGVTADQIYTGGMSNSGEVLELRDSSGNLIDTVDSWYVGDNTSKDSKERTDSTQSGTISSNWNTASASYNNGLGTPKAQNSNGSGGGGAPTECTDTTERLNNVSESLGAINVFFNKCAFDVYATTGNKANYNVNLENQLIERINSTTTSIDFATYEINLPNVINALIAKAANGVDVCVIADAKDAADPYYTERFETMRLYIEQMVRGQDGNAGTNDDIIVFSDSILFAVEDCQKRSDFGLPQNFNGLDYVTVDVGSGTESGY